MKKPGDVSVKQQELLRITEAKGTDHNAHIWILKCRNCLNIYGANSTDGWQRKCPQCQKGEAGLPIPTERDGEDWTREEHIIAFQIYSGIDFGKIHMGNPEVIELAALLGRKVGSASRKLANFSRLDPELQARDIRGLEHGSKGEGEVWREFAEHPEALAFESAKLVADRLGKRIEEVAEIDESELPPPGLDREAIIKTRVNQGFFRKRVLAAYGYRCCVTGIASRPLLVASHIVPWAEDKAHRLNPRNGLCLNALHDRAFDRGLMWIDPNSVIRISSKLRNRSNSDANELDWLLSFDGKPLRLPKDFEPSAELLARHAAKSLS